MSQESDAVILEDDSSSRPSQSDGRKSSINPDLRCPICLTLMDDPAMLSGCQHVFCCSCIIEWLKMKPECPLCKRAPKFFKHNFRLAPNETVRWEMPADSKNVIEMRASSEMDSIMLRTSYSADVERHAVMQVVLRLEEEIRMLQHMTFRSFGKESTYKNAIQELQEEQATYENLLNQFSVSARRVIFNEPAFRRVIYLRNLSPRSIVAPEFAVVFNAEYVKSHEELVRTQLMPYILREYSAVSRNEAVDVEGLLKVIFDYLENKISRLETISYLKKRGIRHPHQFLNNLAHFAGTGQSLAVYDQNSEYTPRGSAVLPYISGNDDILVLNSAVNNDVQVVGESNLARSRPNRQTLDRFSRRITELQNRMRDLPRNSNTEEPYSVTSRRTLLGQRPRRNIDNTVVNIGDSSSSSDTNDEEISIEDANNINPSLISPRPSQAAPQPTGPFSLASYVFTPTTNDWRRNYPNVTQTLQRLLPSSNSATANIYSSLVGLGGSNLFSTNNSLFKTPTVASTNSSSTTTAPPTNLISILRQQQRQAQLQQASSSANATQFLSDDEDVLEGDERRRRSNDSDEIVTLDVSEDNNRERTRDSRQDDHRLSRTTRSQPPTGSSSTGKKRSSDASDLNESIEFMGEVKIDFAPTKKHTSAYLVHFEDGVVLSASTTESQVSSQLYSCADVSAAFNIGRLFARRCQMAGITNFQATVNDPETEQSKRRLSFFNALQDAGIQLIEDEPIEHSHINDPNLTWQHFRMKYTRETKLDELDLSLEPGKGVC